MEIKPETQSEELTIYFYMEKQSWQRNFQLTASLVPPEIATKYHGAYLGKAKVLVDLTSHENRVKVFLAHLNDQETQVKAQAQEALNAIADHKSQLLQLTFQPET